MNYNDQEMVDDGFAKAQLEAALASTISDVVLDSDIEEFDQEEDWSIGRAMTYDTSCSGESGIMYEEGKGGSREAMAGFPSVIELGIDSFDISSCPSIAELYGLEAVEQGLDLPEKEDLPNSPLNAACRDEKALKEDVDGAPSTVSCSPPNLRLKVRKAPKSAALEDDRNSGGVSGGENNRMLAPLGLGKKLDINPKAIFNWKVPESPKPKIKSLSSIYRRLQDGGSNHSFQPSIRFKRLTFAMSRRDTGSISRKRVLGSVVSQKEMRRRKFSRNEYQLTKAQVRASPPDQSSANSDGSNYTANYTDMASKVKARIRQSVRFRRGRI